VGRSGWRHCGSSAIEAFRYLDDKQVLQLVFVDGQVVYEYPCPPPLYEAFVAAPSKGRFHTDVLQPYAEQQGWSPRPEHWLRGEVPPPR
jgi:hypothetical protein